MLIIEKDLNSTGYLVKERSNRVVRDNSKLIARFGTLEEAEVYVIEQE